MLGFGGGTSFAYREASVLGFNQAKQAGAVGQALDLVSQQTEGPSDS